MALESKIREFLRERIASRTYTGAAVIFGKGGQPAFSVYEGQISAGHSIAVNSSTVFDLQSMTKALVTGPLLIKAVNEGRLSLDTKVASSLPRFAPSNSAHQEITIRHLATHSSGLSDDDLEGTFLTAFDYWHHIFSAKPRFQPGTAIEYSDLGYRILGKVLEQAYGKSLETASSTQLFGSDLASQLSYSPVNPFNVAGCPDAHGTIDDAQVHTLGGILGCDGLFGNAEGVFKLVNKIFTEKTLIGTDLNESLQTNTLGSSTKIDSFFDSLAAGSKTIGWEVASADYSYSGKFRAAGTLEKAGGAGTFVWFNPSTRFCMVYLTNHGKPKPFDSKSWNRMIADVSPQKLSNLIYEQTIV